MEKHIETMKRTLELSETCLKGIEYIKSRLNEGAFEETMSLFSDVVEAYSTMENSFQSFLANLSENRLQERTMSLRNALDHVVTAYEQRHPGKALEIIQFNLLPSYKKWKAEIDQVLIPYLVS